MPRKNPNKSALLEVKLSELTDLVKDLFSAARVEIAFTHYEDEDAAIDHGRGQGSAGSSGPVPGDVSFRKDPHRHAGSPGHLPG